VELARKALPLVIEERYRGDDAELLGIDDIEIGALAIIAGNHDVPRQILALASPTPSNWFARVLSDTARSWLCLASGDGNAVALADAAHRALVAWQKSEEPAYLESLDHPRRGAALLMAAYFLSHAVHCLANGDDEAAGKAAASAVRMADAGVHTPLSVSAQWISRVARHRRALAVIDEGAAFRPDLRLPGPPSR
jgi:hypothetical protein